MDQPKTKQTGQGKISDHLANERTFLAWVRTGIATISLGFVIARFSFWLDEIAIVTGSQAPSTELSLPIGLGMVAFGGLMTLLSAFRYRAIYADIEENRLHPGSGLIVLTTAGVIVLALTLIFYLLLAARQLP